MVSWSYLTALKERKKHNMKRKSHLVIQQSRRKKYERQPDLKILKGILRGAESLVRMHG